MGHDTTLMGILAGIDSKLGEQMPEPGSRIVIELLEATGPPPSSASSGGAPPLRFYVRVRYNGEPVQIGDCPTECPVSRFATILAPVVPTSLVEWSTECSNTAADI